MSEYTKQTPDKLESLPNDYRWKKLIAAAAIPIGMLGVTGSEQNKTLTPQELIATRYDCTLSSLTNGGGDIPRAVRAQDNNPRAELRVGVNLAHNPEAARALKRYENDDMITWSYPKIEAVVIDTQGNRLPMLGSDLRDQDLRQKIDESGDGNDRLEQSLYPQTTYPSGTRADFSVTEVVSRVAPEGIYRIRSTQFCGRGIFDAQGKQWKLEVGSEPPMPASEHILDEEFSEWQSVSGESTVHTK